jgi:toxin ParE1/3/4
MSVRVSLHGAAERELADAAEYYEAASSGLGHAFLDDVESAIEHIRSYPESGHLLNQAVRRVLLRRFPYAVMYSSESQEIRILAIASLRRRPFYWRGRE